MADAVTAVAMVAVIIVVKIVETIGTAIMVTVVNGIAEAELTAVNLTEIVTAKRMLV